MELKSAFVSEACRNQGNIDWFEKWKCLLLSHVQLFVTPWTVAHRAPLSTEILQARILEWIAIPFSRESSRPRDRAWVSHIAGRFFTIWATREVPQKALPSLII